MAREKRRTIIILSHQSRELSNGTPSCAIRKDVIFDNEISISSRGLYCTLHAFADLESLIANPGKAVPRNKILKLLSELFEKGYVDLIFDEKHLREIRVL